MPKFRTGVWQQVLYVADLDEQLPVYLSRIPRPITHAQYMPTAHISVRLGQQQGNSIRSN